MKIHLLDLVQLLTFYCCLEQKLKEENAAQVEEYGFCTMDGHKEKIGNFKIEPPGFVPGTRNSSQDGHVEETSAPRGRHH